MAVLVFEHGDFILANKPADESFHSERGEGFMARLERERNEKLFSVHRLDKMTSGLLLFARSSDAANRFAQLFLERSVEKYYLAVSLRKPKKKQGWVKGDMAKSRRGGYKLLPSKNNPAVTRFLSTPLRRGERLFLLQPYTGRTHQLRVALKAIGAPIAGDLRYSDTAAAKEEERGYLHAYALRFVYKDKAYSFTCKPDFGERFCSPEAFLAYEKFADPWELF